MGDACMENVVVAAEPQAVPYGISAGTKVADLKDETLIAFSDSPFEFEDSSANLWGDTQKVYYNACVANRFSENYLMLCEQLEKNIKRLGSLCLTKAALEQKGMKFPKLAGMNILSLVKMVSFHFRKAHAALEGVYIDNNILALSYLDWEFRWVGLGNRLKATEVKIQKIKSGEIRTESLIRQEKAACVTPGFGSNPASLDKKASALPEAFSALPINSSIVRKMLEGNAADVIVAPEPEQDILSEEDIREVLMEDARQRHDQDAIRLISTEELADLINRCDLYFEQIVRDVLPP